MSEPITSPALSVAVVRAGPIGLAAALAVIVGTLALVLQQNSPPTAGAPGPVPTFPLTSLSPSVGGSAAASDSADTAQAQAQASAVGQLLTTSVNSRTSVRTASEAVMECRDQAWLARARRTLAQAVTTRLSLARQAAMLDVSQVPDAAPAMQMPSRAWSETATADQYHANWASAMQNGDCSPGHAPATNDHHRASDANALAANDKNAFLVAWNPIASTYGLPTRTSAEI